VETAPAPNTSALALSTSALGRTRFATTTGE